MSFRAKPVRRPREQIEDQLRQAIVSSTFKRGERLPSEAQLAKEFQVSRTTIREALRAVAAEGLISKQLGATGGSFVETVNHESLGTQLSDSMGTILKLGTLTQDEVAAVREMLAVPAARLAALNRSDDQLESLREVLEQASSASVGTEEMTELDLIFHNRVATASGNRLLIAFLSAHQEAARPRQFIDPVPAVTDEMISQHRAIFDAIAAADGEAAAEAMSLHLSYFHRVTHGDDGGGRNGGTPVQ